MRLAFPLESIEKRVFARIIGKAYVNHCIRPAHPGRVHLLFELLSFLPAISDPQNARREERKLQMGVRFPVDRVSVRCAVAYSILAYDRDTGCCAVPDRNRYRRDTLVFGNNALPCTCKDEGVLTTARTAARQQHLIGGQHDRIVYHQGSYEDPLEGTA